ncbi:capsular biosynthesis protein [Bacillus lacus]|uniref:Capsular biosynthesis protein n=1 Tax=Metabacillus lacus TaxID=1983721 RepID=A0A7X2M0M1_9BACI|nr:Wzz/FepE/Etk N-terminal domain-containing protein [Metabacillus lacus]MRX73009.1 capsular biosynthesis protein [Metabacillus lacus]
MEETISLKELFSTLKKRLALIIIITALATATSGIISYFFLTPVYSTSTQILVNQSKGEQQIYNVSEIQTNIQLINTYSVIITSPTIIDKVREQLNTNMTNEELRNSISVANERDSQVFRITAEHPDPALAVQIANTTASVFQTEIQTIMNVDNVSILSQADLGETPSPIKPRPSMNMAIALVVGLMAGVGLAFLLEYLDNTIKNETDIEKMLELPVLGAITQIDHESEMTTNVPEPTASRMRGESVGS